MEPIYGSRLSEVENIDNPQLVLERIIDSMRTAYQKGYVNGDLNEYNVIIENDNIFILDWPQAIKVDSVNANTVLARDVKNILKFFSRRFEIDSDIQNTINTIQGLV
jgi:RIO kinase 2